MPIHITTDNINTRILPMRFDNLAIMVAPRTAY
jgi:hypothetical protein